MAPLAPWIRLWKNPSEGHSSRCIWSVVSGQSRWELPHWVMGSMFHVTAARRRRRPTPLSTGLEPGDLADADRWKRHADADVDPGPHDAAGGQGWRQSRPRSGRDGERLSPAESTGSSSSSSSRGAAAIGPTLPRRRGARPAQRVARPARRAGRPSRNVRHAIPAHVLCAHTESDTRRGEHSTRRRPAPAARPAPRRTRLTSVTRPRPTHPTIGSRLTRRAARGDAAGGTPLLNGTHAHLAADNASSGHARSNSVNFHR